MKIINNTDLSYMQLGRVIDLTLNEWKEDTHYYGQIEHCTFKVGNKVYRLQIRYLARYTEWRFS